MININIVNDRISGSVNGEPFSVEYSEERYNDMVKLQKEEASVDNIEEAQDVWERFSELTTISPKEQIETESEHLTYDPNTDTYHLTNDGKVSPIPMPQSLVDKLLYAVDKNLPVDPVVKFFTRLLRNRNIQEGDSEDAARFVKEVCNYATQTFVSPVLKEKYMDEGASEDVATEMATVPQTPLTMEGLLCTKKVVDPLFDRTKYKYIINEDGEKEKVLRDGFEKTIDEDSGEVDIDGPEYSEAWVFQPTVMGTRGDAFRCGLEEDAPLGHEIRVGKEMRLDSWDQVNTNPNRSCVPGIHTGNQDYIDSWERSNNVTLNCFVDPAVIGAVPYHDVDGVIRVKELFPHSIKDREDENENLYHSSTYADVGDKRWAEYRKEAVERFDDELEELKAKIEEKKELQEFAS